MAFTLSRDSATRLELASQELRAAITALRKSDPRGRGTAWMAHADHAIHLRHLRRERGGPPGPRNQEGSNKVVNGSVESS